MNDKIMSIAISGDGNEKEGLTTVMMDLGQDDCTMIKLINEEDKTKLDDLLMTDISMFADESPLLHIDIFKQYLKNTRSFIYPDNILKKFNSHNQRGLFTLFTKTGNVLIQLTDYSALIYLPKYISNDVRNSIIEMKQYIDENSSINVQQITKDDKISENIYQSYDEFIKNQFNITK